jgi:hypothetical protein
MLLSLGWAIIEIWRSPDATWSVRFRQVASHFASRLPAPVAGFVRTELRLMGAALNPRPTIVPPASADAFTATRTSKGNFVVPLVLLLAAVELPAIHILLYVLLPKSARSLQLGFVVLNLYALLWFVGDRRCRRASIYRLGSSALEIELGERWKGAIPYQLIKNAGMQPKPLPRRDPSTIDVTPFDPPNVTLRLVEPLPFTSYFGITKLARCIRLYVDEPEHFLAAIDNRLLGFTTVERGQVTRSRP